MKPITQFRSAALTVALLTLVDTSPAAAQNGWRMDGFDPSRTNHSAVVGPHTAPNLEILTNNLIGSVRRITDDGVAIVAGGNTVAAYDGSGVLKWQITVVGQLFDVAVGPEGHVYASTATTLVAFDKDSGTPLWSSPYVGNDGNESGSLAIASDGTIFFHSGSGSGGVLGERLAALRPDGTVKWEQSLSFRGYTRVVLSNDESTLYLMQYRNPFGTPYGVISRLSPSTGQILNDSSCATSDDVYLFDLAGAIYTTEYNTNNAPHILAFTPDLSSCYRLPESGTGRLIALTPAGILVQQAYGDPFYPGGQLLGLTRDGHLLWSSAGQYAVGAIADVDGILYATSVDGTSLSAIDTSNGSVLWTQTFGVAVTGVLLGGDGGLYVTAGTELIRLSSTSVGTISVATNLPAAAFSIVGPQTFSGSGTSFTQANAPTGNYTITYGAVAGYSTPASETRPLAAGGTASFIGAYILACASPSIVSQPLSHRITLGKSTSLNTLATGTAPLAYHWYIGVTGDISMPAPGGQAASVSVSPTTTASYWVRVTNQCGYADSWTAAIVVQPVVPVVSLAASAVVTSPTFIQKAETAWNTTTTPKTTASFNVQAGDVLVAFAETEDSTTTVSVSDSTTTSATWINQQTVNVSGYSWVGLWTKQVTSTQSMTVTFTRGGSSFYFGGDVLTFRGSNGVGASVKANVSSGAPTVNLTTTQANSAIVVADADWTAIDGASRVWRANAGAFSEQSYIRVSGRYTVYGGYHPNAGAVGTYALGLSAPSQKYSILAVEVKGNGAADTTPPTVLMTAPANNASVSGQSVAVSATASDNIGVAGVQFKLDGANLGAEDTSSPYSINWDTTATANGAHTLSAVARDAAGNTGQAANVNVTVANPPVISGISATAITTSSAQINWTTNIPADSQVNYGATTAYGFSTTLDASLATSHSQALSSLTPGTLYHYQVLSRDTTAVLAVSADFTFTTANLPDTTPPTVSMTAPANSATVFGTTVTVSAAASDNVGVAGVQFRLDGSNLGIEDTTYPYSIIWNSTTVVNGAHTISAIARDAAGNTTTATAVTVTVSNVAFPVALAQKVSTITTGAASINAVFPSSVTAGNLIVVGVSGWPNPANVTMTDSLGNVYTRAGNLQLTSGNSFTAIFYAKNSKGGADTVTFGGASSGTQLSMTASEFSGLDTVSPLDTSAGTSGSSNAPTSGNMTPTVTGDLVIGTGTHDATIVTTAGSGFSMIAIATDDGNTHQSLATEYKVLGSASATTANFALSASAPWAQAGAMFKPAGSGPSTYSISGTVTPAASGANSTVTLSGASSASTSADVNGNYSFAGLLNGAYTLTPSKAGFTFSPVSQNVTVNSANVSAVNFTATANAGSFTISGSITPIASGANSTVNLSGVASASTSADVNGNYSFAGLLNGAYTVTPSKIGFAFSPISQNVTVNSANVGGVNFTAAASAGSLTHVGGASGHPAVTNQIFSLNYTPVTVNDAVVVLAGCISSGITSMTLTAPGWTFTPISGLVGPSGISDFMRTFGAIVPNTAPVTFSITLTGGNGTCSNDAAILVDEFSGNDATGGATTFDAHNESMDNTVTTGVCTGAPVIPANNNDAIWYACYDNVNAVTGGYTKGQDDLNGDWTEYKILSGGQGVVQNPSFVTTSNTFALGGVSIKPLNGSGHSLSGQVTPATNGTGATLTLSGTSSAATSADVNGNYSFAGLLNGAYTVTPSKIGFTFSPISQNVTVNSANVSGVNFTATANPTGVQLVQNNFNGNESATANLSVPFTANNTAGNVLVVSATAARPARTLSISDSAGDTFVQAYGPINDPLQDVDMTVWYVQSARGGVNTVTITPPANSALEIHVSEWSGMPANVVVDQTASATGNGTAVSSGAATTTANGELVFGEAWVNNTAGAGAGFTALSLINGDLDEYQVQPSAGSVATTFTQSVSGQWLAIMVTFKPAGLAISGNLTSLGSGATVKLFGPSNVNFVTTADASGNYVFGGLTNGSYTIVPTSPSADFPSFTQNITVSGSNVTGVNFTATATPNLFFYDNFTAASIDPRWQVISRHGEYAQGETECNAPSQVVQGNADLSIVTAAQTTSCGDFNIDGSVRTPPAPWPYLTGDLQWKSLSFTYGTVVIRAKLPPIGSGLWPAFWLLGQGCQATNPFTADTGYSTCPDTSSTSYNEIDWVECIGLNGNCNTNLFSGGHGGNECGTSVDNNWHTWTLKWTSTNISLSKDGVPTGCSYSSPGKVIPSVPMFLIMQTQTTGPGGIAGNPNNALLPASFTIDYVKVTQ